MIAEHKSSSSGPVTQQEIANQLGVSRQLVTHVLNKTHRTRISAEMRHKIEATAREMNYRPRRLTTHNIGYLLPATGAFLEAEHVFALYVGQIAQEAGYRLNIVNVQKNAGLNSLSETFNAKTVDGVISSCWLDGKIRQALPDNIPLVLVADDDGIADDVDVISMDAHATAQIMTQYLLDYGHRRIGLVMSAEDKIKQHRDFFRGVQDTMQRNGLPSKNLVGVRGAIEEVVPNLGQSLTRPEAPTAWIASSPMYTSAVLLGLYAHGHSVPKTASVISLFDSPSYAASPIPLTATTAFGKAVAEKAVARLIAQIEGEKTPPSHLCAEAKIIERASVGPPQAVKK